MYSGMFILDPGPFETIYGDELATEIAQLVSVDPRPRRRDEVLADLSQLADVELIFSGWGGPVLDEAFLAAAPKLRAVFYGAGSIRFMATEAFWASDIAITCAAALNGVPVANFTLAQILFSLKLGWEHLLAIREGGPQAARRLPVAGDYHSKVGVISLGVIGRLVCERLRPFDLEVLAYDPFVPDARFAELGVRRADLETIFAECDVVTLHAPNLPSTRKMIRGEHFAAMKPHATFINTSRGDIVDEPAMTAVLAARPDLWACLDVLAELDKSAQERLYRLPNVVHTPHIAGSMGAECRRMGRGMVDELRRWLAGEPLRWRVTREQFELMA